MKHKAVGQSGYVMVHVMWCVDATVREVANFRNSPTIYPLDLSQSPVVQLYEQRS